MSSHIATTPVGTHALAEKGWIKANRWLLLRRCSQLLILALFLSGPWLGWWIVKGNLNYSLTLDTLPLTDPYLMLQSFFAGQWPENKAVLGGLIVLAIYLLLGGRVYCAWVCPVNPLTDLAAWLRQRFKLKSGTAFSRSTRIWVLLMTLVVAALTGTIAWEMLNPVSMLHRGLIFGLGAAWMIVMAVFLFDLFVMRRGWCGHLCPVGAFYGLMGRFSVLQIKLPRRHACNQCMDCYVVCPEQQVIRPALEGINGAPPVISDADCSRCGRCIDVCSKDVFAFGSRFSPPPVDGSKTSHAASSSLSFLSGRSS